MRYNNYIFFSVNKEKFTPNNLNVQQKKDKKSYSNVKRSLFTDDENNINFEKNSSKILGNYYGYTFCIVFK